MYRKGLARIHSVSRSSRIPGNRALTYCTERTCYRGSKHRRKRKNLVIALFGASAPGGTILGDLFNATFGQLSFWPWTFWTIGIVCLAWNRAAVVGWNVPYTYVFLIISLPLPRSPNRQIPARPYQISLQRSHIRALDYRLWMGVVWHMGLLFVPTLSRCLRL